MSQTKIASWILSEAISVEPHKNLTCNLNDRRVHQMDSNGFKFWSETETFWMQNTGSPGAYPIWCLPVSDNIRSIQCKGVEMIPQYDRIRWGKDDGMMALSTSHAWVGPIAITLIMTTVDISANPGGSPRDQVP